MHTGVAELEPPAAYEPAGHSAHDPGPHPLHTYAGSTAHVALQPSPGTTPASSHASDPSSSTPSPHAGVLPQNLPPFTTTRGAAAGQAKVGSVGKYEWDLWEE